MDFFFCVFCLVRVNGGVPMSEVYKLPPFVANLAVFFLFLLNIPLAVFTGFMFNVAVDSPGAYDFLDVSVIGLVILAVVMNRFIIWLHRLIFKAENEKYAVAHLWLSVVSCYFVIAVIPALLISLYAIFRKRKLAKMAFILSVCSLLFFLVSLSFYSVL